MWEQKQVFILSIHIERDIKIIDFGWFFSKKKTLNTISTNRLVLAPHQKGKEEARRVDNQHHEADGVLPREVVRRP